MTAQELIERAELDCAELDEETRRLATPEMPLRPFVERLARAGRERDAVSAIAQLLPKADAVAWALESVRKMEGTSAKPPAAAALKSIEDWLKEPSDERRRAAYAAAEQAGLGSPAGCLGLAVFLSGGSMAPATAPVTVEPAPHLCGKTVAGAIMMATVTDPRNAAAHCRAFLDRGFQRADALKLWEEK